MQIKHYPEEKLKKDLIKVIGKRLDLSKYRLFFFGSRVVGGGSDRSDIDIGIEGHMSIPLNIISSIKEDIESLPTLYTIDVVDFRRVSPDFRKVSLQNIRNIN